MIWFALGFGLTVSLGMIIGSVRRAKARNFEQMEQLRRREIVVKLKHRTLLNEELQKTFVELEKHRQNLIAASEHLEESSQAGDSERENTSQVRGYIEMEQIEGYMEKAERLLDEIQDIDVQLEALENES